MRRFLTDVMRVQLDNTKQNFIYLSETSKFKKTIVALKLIFGKILLDKDWPFFCPHINAITTTLRILFIFWWFAKLRVSDRARVLKYQLECGKVQWLQTHCGQALIFLGKSLSKDMLFLCPQWSSGPYISRNFLIWTHFVNASWKKSHLRKHISSTTQGN